MNKEENENLNNTKLRWVEPKKERFISITGLILILVWICGIMMYASYAKSRSQSSRSHQIFKLKGAFLYNFIRFVEWPEDKMGDQSKPVIIGVIGKDAFENALEPIKDKKVKGRKVVLKRFKSFSQIKQLDKAAQEKEIEAIGACYLLFVCNSEKAHVTELVKLIRKYNVLTVGDMEDFLNQGGIINFTMVQNKIRFNINMTAAQDSGLKIRSQLLRLAKTVIKKKIAAADAGGS